MIQSALNDDLLYGPRANFPKPRSVMNVDIGRATAGLQVRCHIVHCHSSIPQTQFMSALSVVINPKSERSSDASVMADNGAIILETLYSSTRAYRPR